MTNILPQIAQMNRGAWLLTEEIVECYRDIDELVVIGGVWWDENVDERFLLSHGLPDVPDAYWKVVIRKDRALAWWIPNTLEASKKHLGSYIVSAAFIQKNTVLSYL
ncbi:MAG: endonuclease G [Enterobacterales bacterium]|jgi:endonuclease G